jgi:hypothetical protein
MAVVRIPVSSMVVMRVMTFVSVGAFPVPTIAAEIMTSFMVTTAVIILVPIMVTAAVGMAASFIIPIVPVIGTFFPVSMLLVVLRFVSPPFSRSIFPIIGKRNSGAAKDCNDDNVEDGRRFHWLSPCDPKKSKYYMP